MSTNRVFFIDASDMKKSIFDAKLYARTIGKASEIGYKQ